MSEEEDWGNGQVLIYLHKEGDENMHLVGVGQIWSHEKHYWQKKKKIVKETERKKKKKAEAQTNLKEGRENVKAHESKGERQ